MPNKSMLGKQTTYKSQYSPELLFPIARQEKRNEIGIINQLPFVGFDLWIHYEVSWLNPKGKPIVALAQIQYPCESLNIIESKSMKLYFNSFNNTMFDDVSSVTNIITKDLSAAINAQVSVVITELNQLPNSTIYTNMQGICLDNLDINCNNYQLCTDTLQTQPNIVEETLFSNLLKSNCLITNQPDWGSIQITYNGQQINHAGLLQYLVSFRNHNEFHEQCIERIFVDLMQYCKPNKLAIYGCYTRRGGVEINVYRGTYLDKFIHHRLIRQ
jgi:7-cyano-7-deazaguanine reductase